MEPLVAESVVLSASGEPIRPDRKTQSPTSPRTHASDDEGTCLSTSSSLKFGAAVIGVGLLYYFLFAISFHFISSSIQFTLLFTLYVTFFGFWQISLSSKSSSSSGGCQTRTARRSRTTSTSSIGRLVFSKLFACNERLLVFLIGSFLISRMCVGL